MTEQFLRNDAIIMLGRQDRNWVAVGSDRNENNHDLRTYQTKLLFSESFPASAFNRATRVGPPVPIVIEKLLTRSEVHESVDSSKRSISFTALSEERLLAAVKLAKRDLRRRHLEGLKKLPAKPLQESTLSETSDVELLQELGATSSKTEAKISSPKERIAQTGVKQHIFKKNVISSMPHGGQIPPTRDPGLKQVAIDKQAPLSNEINKLQNELERYIQKVEELAKRGGKMEEPLEPEEQNKLEIRRQKQAAHSARVIYVLQQQVKEIQEDVEKLRCEKTWNTKRSIAINRLAAAHRGTLRALQVIIHQLSDLSYNKVPPYYKELGQLIRQLSLCSAKVEVNQGSAVPETALDILQKVEILDSALSKQEMFEKVQAQTCPQRSTSPTRPTYPRRGVCVGRRLTRRKPKSASHQPTKRREALRVGLQSIIQQRALKEQPRPSQKNTTCRKQHAERRKTDVIGPNQKQNAGFQLPTVSSRLRVNQQPVKEQSVPWIPTSPHSRPQQRKPVRRGRPEPRCPFPPVKISSSPTKQQQEEDGVETEFLLSSAKKKDSQNEAIRKAHLEEVNRQKLKELNHLSKEEPERTQRSRFEVVRLNPWADGAEQKARETLFHEKQQDGETQKSVETSQRIRFSEQKSDKASDAAGQRCKVLLEDLLEDDAHAAWAAETDRRVEGTSQCGRQAPTLESMLLRMEEIQREEEEVRRRFASITYSDPLFWERPGAEGSQCHAPGSRPASPQPIRLTRPVLKQTSVADIVLEKPVDTGGFLVCSHFTRTLPAHLFKLNSCLHPPPALRCVQSFLLENAPMEEASQEEQPPTNKTVSPGTADRSRTVISVSGCTLRNIRRYQDDYDTYLRDVAHNVVGTFNPWAVVDSLADELLLEALAEVADEFQEVVEEYAEAVFTSEFLQPIQSPPVSSAALVGQ
ncbi:protein moonraker isoform X4 [Nothobranchius furzeri]|uniref:Transcript variant X1 n=1 Tax=Nothobranchius furzeri TaxID=105023 RepID=A0A9D2YD73_NOTFU|nr:protein moonraker isoform X4 [Nothobranchius furzeri]KAF7218684.1 transcript variant X1 [Nothobranchius furzeri]